MSVMEEMEDLRVISLQLYAWPWEEGWRRAENEGCAKVRTGVGAGAGGVVVGPARSRIYRPGNKPRQGPVLALGVAGVWSWAWPE